MELNLLPQKYYEQIEIEDTDYVPVNDAPSDAAYLLLRIPSKMLDEYQKLREEVKSLPNANEFLRETGILEYLRKNLKPVYRGGHEPLADILEFLEGDFEADFEVTGVFGKIRLRVIEVINGELERDV